MTEEPIFTARDDHSHFDQLSADWWETETAWFSFYNAERRLGGWLYTLIRPNIGTVAGGAWVWDDRASLPWEVPYSANYSALELPADADLANVRLPTGVAIRVLEPTMSYAIGYEDGDRLRATLRFDGVMPPRALVASGSTFGRARHFDQFGRVTGELRLHAAVQRAFRRRSRSVTSLRPAASGADGRCLEADERLQKAVGARLSVVSHTDRAVIRSG